MTLEKGKEDSSKYYLGYPEPPVLEMRWAICDSNIVEWANIPKFSALDNLVTRLRLLELFSNDVLVDIIFDYIKLYSRESRY